MILGFILVLSIIGIALSLSMYANLLPFIGTLGDVKQYNMAYYGAQSSLERSLLVLRYQDAGFEWEGGRIASTNIGPVSDYNPTFGQFMATNSELYRQITSRGSQIPLSWLGNVDIDFLSGTSNEYNTLDYNAFDVIQLGYDSTSDDRSYVQDSRYLFNTGVSLSVQFRLNPVAFRNFNTVGWALCSDNGCDADGDGVDDDVAVDWWWKWKYTNGASSGMFSIFPYQSVSYLNGVGSVQNDDEAVRESLISDVAREVLRFGVGGDSFNPVSPSFGRDDGIKHLIVTDNDTLSGTSFATMLQGSTTPSFGFQQLSLGLINPLYAQQGSLYPFLEYKILCNGCGTQDGESQLAQPYFYITAQSKIWDYDVRMQLIRSSQDDSLVSSFTVIF